MKKKFTVMLASAMFIPPYAASQSTQHDSMSEQKPQKVYHIGGDVKPPRVITSFQPTLDEQQTKQLSAGKESRKTASTRLKIVVGEDGTV